MFQFKEASMLKVFVEEAAALASMGAAKAASALAQQRRRLIIGVFP